MGNDASANPVVTAGTDFPLGHGSRYMSEDNPQDRMARMYEMERRMEKMSDMKEGSIGPGSEVHYHVVDWQRLQRFFVFIGLFIAGLHAVGAEIVTSVSLGVSIAGAVDFIVHRKFDR